MLKKELKYFIQEYNLITESRTTYDDIKDKLKTGDVVLFFGAGAISEAIELVTGDECTHAGVVIDNSHGRFDGIPRNELLIAEAYLGTDGAIDVISGKEASNCRLVSLRIKLETYNAKRIAIRQLLCLRDREDEDDLKRQKQRRDDAEKELVQKMLYAREHFVYDSEPLDFFAAIEANTIGIPARVMKETGSESSRRYCSAFVAYLYRESGIFLKAEQSGWHDRDFFPKHYSSETFDSFDLPFSKHFAFSFYQPYLVFKSDEIIYY